ncbi:MAG TPA: hypothetical protein VL123_07555 [Candidatus Udaeobacter sp.]|jgi:hypothetical protein|nr:hypothetical protein [Candidatus Udaeobacter sp.]
MGVPERAPVTTDDAQRDAREALQEIMKRHVAMQIEPRTRHRTNVQAITAIVLCAATVYLWTANPSWLREPDLKPTPEYSDASLRWCVYVTSQRIEQYRLAHLKLPASLMQTGSVPGGIHYVRLDDQHYRVEGQNGVHSITFHSGDDVKALLGDHLDALGFARRSAS